MQSTYAERITSHQLLSSILVGVPNSVFLRMVGNFMVEGTLVFINDHAAAGTKNRGKYGIVLNSKLAWEADELDETLLVSVLVPATGEELSLIHI